MFSPVNHFQMFKAGMLVTDVGRCGFKQENESKASNFAKQPRQEVTKDTVYIENMQSNKMSIIQHQPKVCWKKYSNVIPLGNPSYKWL